MSTASASQKSVDLTLYCTVSIGTFCVHLREVVGVVTPRPQQRRGRGTPSVVPSAQSPVGPLAIPEERVPCKDTLGVVTRCWTCSWEHSFDVVRCAQGSGRGASGPWKSGCSLC